MPLCHGTCRCYQIDWLACLSKARMLVQRLVNVDNIIVALAWCLACFIGYHPLSHIVLKAGQAQVAVSHFYRLENQ